VREDYFALLIPSKWESCKEYVQTIKCLLQFYLDKRVYIGLTSYG